MTPRKVIVVSDFKETKGEPLYYDVAQHLMHGFIQAGHFATRFSDRDVARSLGLGYKMLGVPAMKRRLRDLAKTIRPDLILFGHADLFDERDFAQLRADCAGVRLAQLNVDSPHRLATMRRFAGRTPYMDVSFFTAAELAPAADLFDPAHPIFYTPPATSPALETGRAFELPNDQAPRDVAFLGSVCVDRPAQIAELQRRLPAAARFEVLGAVNGTPGVTGAAFVDFMSQTPMSPSLQPDTGVAEAALYMSTRVPQLMGNGVLAFAHRSTGLDAIFDDGVRLFDDIATLADDIARFVQDDAQRRATAEIGWRLARERVAASVVCQYMLDVSLGESPKATWPSQGSIIGPR